MNTDLSTATMSELISEIQDRSKASLIVALMPDKVGDTETPLMAYNAGPYMALGLCKAAEEGLRRELFVKKPVGEVPDDE